MNSSSEEWKILTSSRPLQSIRAIEQSLMVLRHKLTQMNKRESQNARQIQKVFYSSIPNLKNKLYQTIECQKVQQKKKIFFNQNILSQKKKINKQRKMINEKEILRNKELTNMAKINQHNSIKEKSRKNQFFIEKMKNIRLKQNMKKKELIKGSLQNSRHQIQDFQTTKQLYTYHRLEEIRKQKQEDSFLLQNKMTKMKTEISYLGDKENRQFQKLDKSEEALNQLRFAVERMQKMNEKQFLKLKNKIHSEIPSITEQKLIQKMLLHIIESQKPLRPTFHSRKIYHSKWSSEHLNSIQQV